MTRFCFTLLLLIFLLPALAQENIYNSFYVPADLKKNANTVKREEKILFEIKTKNKAYYTVHKVITVLSEAGKNELLFYEFTDKFVSLEEVAIELFDSKGVSQNKYRKEDLYKQAAGDGLVPDGKIYIKQLSVLKYPVTVRIDYTLKFNGILNYPDYRVQIPDQAVENSDYTARVPAELDLRYKPKNTAIVPEISVDGKTKIYKWKVSHLPALADETGTVSRESRYPTVLLAPNKFELDGYEGDMSSWQNFGYWYGNLAKDAINLTEERKQFFIALVKNARRQHDASQLDSQREPERHRLLRRRRKRAGHLTVLSRRVS